LNEVTGAIVAPEPEFSTRGQDNEITVAVVIDVHQHDWPGAVDARENGALRR
jgi:hypothetical protein